MKIWHFVYYNTGLVQNLGHLNIFLELWAQLFQENLGTCRLAIKLEGTLGHTTMKSLPGQHPLPVWTNKISYWYQDFVENASHVPFTNHETNFEKFLFNQ